MRRIAVLLLAVGVFSGLGAAQIRASKVASPQPWLLFDSTRTGRSEVYALSKDGKELRQLTFIGARAPRPAPNGRLVLFDRGGDTWITRADGRGAHRLFHDADQATWAPDSRRVAYVSETGGIAVAERDGSGTRALTHDTNDRYPHWSPDGRAIAFLRGERLIVRRGGRGRAVATDVSGRFAWSPDGHRIAFQTESALALVNADGSHRRTLVDGASAPPVWSPDGKLIAWTYGLPSVVTVATGRVRQLAQHSLFCSFCLFTTSEGAWTPSGDAFAFVEAASVLGLVGLDGHVMTLRTEDAVRSTPFEFAWTTPPADVAYRKPSPARPPIVPSGFELKLKAPVAELAADGKRVAFVSCREVGAWTVGARSSTEVHRERPLCIGNTFGAFNPYRYWGVAAAGNHAAYETVSGGNVIEATLEVAGPTTHVSIPGAPTTRGAGTGLDFVLGHGSLLVFSTWSPGIACYGPSAPCPDARGQPLWRIPLPLDGAGCARVSGDPAEFAPPCRKISSEPVLPLAVDDTRVVVRRVDGSVSILDADGRQLLSIPFAPGEADGAEIAGEDLVVHLAGALRDYDAATGALLHTWSAPVGLQLEDAARGLAVYILDGNLHLLRLRDGADTVVAQATAAQLEDDGLFYAHAGAYPFVGRIRFTPFDQLPLR